jgi:hypothetical protein
MVRSVFSRQHANTLYHRRLPIAVWVMEQSRTPVSEMLVNIAHIAKSSS